MAYLAAINTATTIPLFIRIKGELPELSFPVVGSLSSVHLYASSMKAALHSCSSAGSKVVWNCFYDSVTLILVTGNEGGSDTHLTHLLELVFNALVLVIGLRELEEVSDPERLKRYLRSCYPLIDHLLHGSPLLSPITQCVEVVVSPDRDLLSKTLDAFTEAAQSSFGCLTVRGRVCVATKSWWGLSSLEKSLLSLFIYSLPPSTASDIPVYLPHASNKVPHRLLSFTLMDGVSVSVLCNPQPPLTVVQDLIHTFWLPIADRLRNTSLLHPRNVPFSLKFESEIAAFCLVNLSTEQCLVSLRPDNLPVKTSLDAGFQGGMNATKKVAYLSKFFKTTVEDLLPLHKDTTPADPLAQDGGGEGDSTLRKRVTHSILETYTHAKRFKAYAIHKDKYNLFVLFNPTTPAFSLRKMTVNLLDYLVLSNKVLSS